MAFTEKQKREHISEIQGYLRDMQLMSGELVTVSVNGIYDDSTREAVRDFQQENGLPMTGEVDSDTWDAIAAAHIRMLRYAADNCFPFDLNKHELRSGGTGLPVRMMQTMLYELGQACDNVPEVEISGELSGKTEEAVRFFRRKCGLSDEGVVDLKTWNMLAGCCRHFRNSRPE